MDNQKKKSPENLGIVRLNNGREAAMLMRERDPTGATVVHAVKRSPYVHERLHSLGKLASELYDAGEKFRIDFERAQLGGNYARMDLHKTRAGRHEISDNVMAAKIRIGKAIEGLGAGIDGPSFSQSCCWNVLGLGMTLDGWTDFVRAGGKSMNSDKAAGILHVSLERLAMHYGLVDMGKLAAITQRRAGDRRTDDMLEFGGVAVITMNGAEKTGAQKLLSALRKRFAPQDQKYPR